MGTALSNDAAGRLAARTEEAFMADSYGEAAWRQVARFLLQKGHSEREAEAILRSKHMRWADDAEGHGAGKGTTSAAFKRYYEKRQADLTGSALAALVAETFSVTRLFAFDGEEGFDPHAVQIELDVEDVRRFDAACAGRHDLGPCEFGEYIRVTDQATGKPYEIASAPCGLGCHCAAVAREMA